MKHTPLGYDIVDGRAVINESEADQIRTMYVGYFLGLSYIAASKMAGIPMTHSQVKHCLQNKRYMGDDFYPQIIDKETFQAAETERKRREKALGRDKIPKKEKPTPLVFKQFSVGTIRTKFSDPIRQAEYAYSQVKPEFP